MSANRLQKTFLKEGDLNMNDRKCDVFVLALIACFSAARARGELKPIAEINLVANGGFEAGRDDRPSGWKPYCKSPDIARMVWSSERPHSGAHCLGIESSYAGNRPWFWWDHQLRSMREGETYRVAGWCRTEGIKRGAIVAMYFHDASGRQIARKYIGKLTSPGTQWKAFRYDIVAPRGTAWAVFRLAMHGSGKVWIDDVRVLRRWRPERIAFAKAKVYPVTRATTPLAVDGRSGDWAGAPRAAVERPYAVSQAEAIIFDRERSKGRKDLSFEFALQHDSKNLHLLVLVRDDVRIARRRYWQGDSIQFAIDTTYGRQRKGFGPGDFALGVALGRNTARAIIDHKPSSSTLAPKDIAVGFANTSDGYVVELGIPWAGLGMKPPKHNQRMGFSIIVNDCDGSGRKWAEWTPGIAVGKSPAKYGTLVFFDGGDTGLSLETPQAAIPDTKPLVLNAYLISMAKKKTTVPLLLALDSSADTDRREVSVERGVTRAALAYEPGCVRPGIHGATLSAGPLFSNGYFEIAPLRKMVDEVRDRLARLKARTETLSSLIEKGRTMKIDVALPDVTLATAEHFCGWIAADVEREGHERLALREAKRLEPLVERAIAEARSALARPALHPSVSPPNVMDAVMRDGGWFVGDRPVFLIGFNGFDKAFLGDLARFGCNFDTSGGGAAAFILRDGPEPNAQSIKEHSVEPIRRAAKLGIRSNIHFGHRIPRWAVEKYPDIADAEGRFMFYDMDHPEARRITCLMIERVARAIRGLPGATCYDLWNEAAFNKMSKRGLKKFRQAMRKQYGTIDRLNAAWRTNCPDFNEIIPVTRAPSKPAAYMDWVRWNNARFTEYVAEMRAAVRRGDPKALTTVKLSNEEVVVGTRNHAYRTQATSRHNMGVDRWALARLLEIQGCDTRPTLLSPDYAFAWRYPGMAYDLQRSMAPTKPIDDSEWHGVQTVYYQNVDQPAEFLNAALWFSYLHGVDMNLIWWWSRKGTEPKTKWFEGSLTTQPQLLDAFGRNSVLVQRFAREIVAFQEAKPRVRILFSKPSAILDLHYLDTMRDAYESLSWLSVPVGFVTEEMLLGGFDALDVLVVPAARHASAGVREAVARLARSGVGVVMIGEGCLRLTPHGRAIDNPTPIETRTLKSAIEIRPFVDALAAAGVARSTRAVGPDGISSKPVEFRTVEQEGRRLGYVIGLGKRPATIRIRRNRRAPRWRSLLTGKRYEESLTVKPYDFDLFVFE